MSYKGLKLDWCSYKAAKFACENYHYSKCLPSGKLMKIGVWEDGRFIGVVIFSRGANPKIGKKYGLEQTQVCELTRVALSNHKTPVTRIISIAFKLLKRACPSIVKVISYADPEQGHKGIVYKAGNWKYEGRTAKIDYYRDKNGNVLHWRTARMRQKKGEKLECFYKEGKYKFVYDLRR